MLGLSNCCMVSTTRSHHRLSYSNHTQGLGQQALARMSLVGDLRCNHIHNIISRCCLIWDSTAVITPCGIQWYSCWPLISVVRHDIMEGFLCACDNVSSLTWAWISPSPSWLCIGPLLVYMPGRGCNLWPALSCCCSVSVGCGTVVRHNSCLCGDDPVGPFFHMFYS